MKINAINVVGHDCSVGDLSDEVKLPRKAQSPLTDTVKGAKTEKWSALLDDFRTLDMSQAEQ
jgi:hypothetical protein